MAGLVFDEAAMLNGNIFKFEQRLQSHVNKYIENGAILTCYYSQKESAITVDRGSRDINQIFGKESPLRFNRIENFPLYGFGQASPNNSDEQQIEDISIEGDCIILPNTIVPKPMDFFIVNHLKMKALFQVSEVVFDTMKEEGYYKIRYRLYSTEAESFNNLEKQTVELYHMDLNAVGSDVNPIIQKDDYILKNKIIQMMNKMIESYRAMFYNSRHNCFIYHDQETGMDYFDMCGNEFIGKHSLLNIENSHDVIVLQDKLYDTQLPLYYNNSIYNWIELGAPGKLLQRFYYILTCADAYPTSSFSLWDEGDIQIMTPITPNQAGRYTQDYSYFDNTQLKAFMNDRFEVRGSEFDKLIWKYIHNPHDLSIKDISLNTGDVLFSSIKHIDVFLYTPIIIYIIREILNIN